MRLLGRSSRISRTQISCCSFYTQTVFRLERRGFLGDSVNLWHSEKVLKLPHHPQSVEHFCQSWWERKIAVVKNLENCYRPQTKSRGGNVFTGVCLFRVGVGTAGPMSFPEGGHLWYQVPTGGGIMGIGTHPPGWVCPPGMGTHPTPSPDTWDTIWDIVNKRPSLPVWIHSTTITEKKQKLVWRRGQL